MAMAASAPVPYKTEGGPGFTGATYTKHPLATGPFMIKSYTPNKSIIFVRNPYWSQTTDTIRHPLVNEVDLTVDTDPVDIDKKLQAGTADANASTSVQADVPGADPHRPDAQGQRRRPGHAVHPVPRGHAVGDPEHGLPQGDLLRVGTRPASSGLTAVRSPAIRPAA